MIFAVMSGTLAVQAWKITTTAHITAKNIRTEIVSTRS